MSKVHIALVGGQAAPVYNVIKALQPDCVVFVCSQDSLGTLGKLKDVLDVPSVECRMDPVDPKAIRQEAGKLAERYRNDEVTVNISSGTKPWAYFFSLVFGQYANASIVYMDQNNVLWNYTAMSASEDFEFDMHMQFKLYGNSIENNYIPFEAYTDADRKAIGQIEKIRSFDYESFKELLAKLDTKAEKKLKNSRQDRFDGERGSYVAWERAGNMERVDIVLVRKNGQQSAASICSEHAIHLAFKSGWFEYKVACLLSKWEKAKEICLNCRFPYKSNIDKNEVDIIVNTGTKILFVECKTQVWNSTDVDKFHSVVKTYGGMGSKALFVTLGRMTDAVSDKCDEYKILHFSLADDHKGLGAEKALGWLLNTELYAINTK